MQQIKARKKAVITVIILIMIANAEHFATLYYQCNQHTFEDFFKGNFPVYSYIGVWIDWIISMVVVIVIDFALIVAINNGKYVTASIFAVAIFVLLSMYNEAFGLLTKTDIHRVSQFTFSALFAFSIFRFSILNNELDQLLAGEDQKAATIQQLSATIEQKEAEKKQIQAVVEQKEVAISRLCTAKEELEEDCSDYNAEVVELRKSIEDKNQHFEAKVKEIQVFKSLLREERICPYCASDWSTKAAMISHKGSCAEKPKLVKEEIEA